MKNEHDAYTSLSARAEARALARAVLAATPERVKPMRRPLYTVRDVIECVIIAAVLSIPFVLYFI